LARIRRPDGPPQALIASPPATAPIPAAAATAATDGSDVNDSTSGDVSTNIGEIQRFSAVTNNVMARNPGLPSVNLIP
jgi:hypothetical protein